MSKPLSPIVLRKRMVEWRNYRHLYPELRRKYEEVKEENRQLKRTVAEQQILIEKLLLWVEELERMVFGGKKCDDHSSPSSGSSDEQQPSKQPRGCSSFRRAIPLPEDVTSRKHFPVDTCPDCGTPLQQKERVTRFVEDIPRPKKMVEAWHIERGFCPCCKRIVAGSHIAVQHCTLGPNVRLYILFAVTVLGQTFEKIRAHLHGLHALDVSDGEIANIVQEGHEKLLPAKKEIAVRLNAVSVSHYDETDYPVQGGEQGNYAWIRTSATSADTIFLLGRTRGKGNAEEIRGPPSRQIGMSDDYGAYDVLFDRHVLCWAHPLRKFRDLAQSGVLGEKHRRHCQRFYEIFRRLEWDVALTIGAPLTMEERAAARKRFESRIAAIMAPARGDVPKLATLKATFLGNSEKYLLCVTTPGVPMTNNQAERRLRGLVIKRLLSFGSRTQKGAQAMETVFSVLMTLWWSKPKDYFGELRRLLALSTA